MNIIYSLGNAVCNSKCFQVHNLHIYKITMKTYLFTHIISTQTGNIGDMAQYIWDIKQDEPIENIGDIVSRGRL